MTCKNQVLEFISILELRGNNILSFLISKRFCNSLNLFFYTQKYWQGSLITSGTHKAILSQDEIKIYLILLKILLGETSFPNQNDPKQHVTLQ